MKKHCDRCNQPLLRNGKCPNCDGIKPEEKKKSKIWIPIVIGVVVVAVITAAVLIVLTKDKGDDVSAGNQQGGGSGGGSAAPTFDMSVPHKVEPPNAEELLKSYGQILSKTPATESEQVQDESDLFGDFENRGLNQVEIYAEYNMSGEYQEGYEAYRYSDEQHPIYSTYYAADNGEVWMITSVNGVIMADPYGYNYISNDGSRVPVIVVETDSIYSYDGTTNTFFDFIPDSARLRMVKVDKINSETLESLTSDKLGG